MDLDPIAAGLAGPVDAADCSAASLEALARLDLQAAIHTLMPLAPLGAAAMVGVAGLLLMLALSALARPSPARGSGIADEIGGPIGGHRRGAAPSRTSLQPPRGRG